MIVLGIETSCDETAVAVLKDGKTVLADVVASQTALHQKYGGVVPEVASRCHIETIGPLVREALKTSGCDAHALDAVAVTTTPGLIGALLVGISFARAFAYALHIPCLSVNHLEGHIASAFLEGGEMAFPAIALVASGGHTHLYYAADWGAYRLLGKTRDDAAGEAFDKGARLLGGGYPGGPIIERLARAGDPDKVRFPRPSCGGNHDDFSFSGLKTALMRKVSEQAGPPPSPRQIADWAAGYQAAIVETLIEKTMRAAVREKARSVVLAGGVAANGLLRQRLRAESARLGMAAAIPSLRYCTDNAVMIALAGWMAHRAS